MYAKEFAHQEIYKVTTENKPRNSADYKTYLVQPVWGYLFFFLVYDENEFLEKAKWGVSRKFSKGNK